MLRKLTDTVLIFLCAICILQCGVNNVAGGAGTGNPTGIVTVAIIADSIISASLPKSTPASHDTPGVQRVIPVKDISGNGIEFTTAIMNVQRIHFLVKSGDSPASLVRQSKVDLPFDDNSIILEGPFTFDLISGAMTPQVDTIRLPQASYIGLSLEIGIDRLSPPPIAAYPNAIEFNGFFMNQNKSHPMKVLLTALSSVTFHFANAWAWVSPDQPLTFLLPLDASQWLDSIDFTGSLKNGDLSYDACGGLVVTDRTGQGTDGSIAICKVLQKNIIRSGKLIFKNK